MGRATPFALVLLGTVVVLRPADARCRFDGLEADYARAEMVYEATLILAEYIPDEPPYDPDKQPPPEDQYRFVLRVDRVYKGNPGATVEKRKRVDGVQVLSGTPLLLEDQVLRTRLLIFEPGWDSGCSQSKVIDAEVERVMLPRLRSLSAPRMSS